jgi:pimeloyl-ACP methyl ester carboxylesterase
MAASRLPGCFDRLYLFEPIALDPKIRAAEELPPPLAGAARRRALFGSREEAFEYLRGRPPLSFIDVEVFAAYIEYGIHPTQEGVRLACDPAFEAAMYRAGYEADITPLLAEVTCPVVVAYGTAGGGIGAACAPKVAEQVPGARLVGIEGLTHLGPLERPALVAQSIQRFLDTPGA